MKPDIQIGDLVFVSNRGVGYVIAVQILENGEVELLVKWRSGSESWVKQSEAHKRGRGK